MVRANRVVEVVSGVFVIGTYLNRDDLPHPLPLKCSPASEGRRGGIGF